HRMNVPHGTCDEPHIASGGLRRVAAGSESVAMDPDKTLTPALGEARKRRQTLHDAIVQLEMAISSPAAGRMDDWRGQVTKDMVGVRDAFDQHIIVTEKPGGLYEEIMERAPRLAGTVKRLQDEHPTIEASIAKLLARLEAGEVDSDTWPLDRARDDLQRLIGAVVRHRQKGADLVWEAYNVDIGGTEQRGPNRRLGR